MEEISQKEGAAVRLPYDVIVCTHPMCVKAIASYKEKTGLKTPLVTCIEPTIIAPVLPADAKP